MVSCLERHHGPENLLLVFRWQHFGLKDALNCSGNLGGCQAVGAIQNPYDLSHRHHAYKAGVRQVQSTFNDFRCFGRLNRVILGEVAYENIRIETDHWRFARGEPPAPLPRPRWSFDRWLPAADAGPEPYPVRSALRLSAAEPRCHPDVKRTSRGHRVLSREARVSPSE